MTAAVAYNTSVLNTTVKSFVVTGTHIFLHLFKHFLRKISLRVRLKGTLLLIFGYYLNLIGRAYTKYIGHEVKKLDTSVINYVP